MARRAESLTVSADNTAAACLLAVDGVLSSATYRTLRDLIIKAALEEPAAVLVDVDGLEVPAPSAWSVFTSARWHVSRWPDIPIGLVCSLPARRAEIARNGVTRYVPAFATASEATTALADRTLRKRARTELPASLASLRESREFVGQWLAEWGHSDLIPTATIVVNVLVENALQHTATAPALRVEAFKAGISISVQDGSSNPAVRREDPLRGGDRISGLAIVAAISRAWGCSPTPPGKTVWAVIGPENRL